MLSSHGVIWNEDLLAFKMYFEARHERLHDTSDGISDGSDLLSLSLFHAASRSGTAERVSMTAARSSSCSFPRQGGGS
jgi:hypothetical protein